MRKIFHTSKFGGKEIIQVRYPAIANQLINYKESTEMPKSTSVSTTVSEEIKQSHNFKKLNSISEFKNTIIVSQMKSIPAFFNDSVIIYSPDNVRKEFWLDMLTLNYFYSLKEFDVCLLFLTGDFLSSNRIQYQEFLDLLDNRSFSLLHFPYDCYVEVINMELPT